MNLLHLSGNLRKYILGGDDFLRQTRGTKFSDAMLLSIRRGFDSPQLARDVLPGIECLERNVAAVKQLWVAGAARMITLLLLIIVARMMMLSPVSEDVWAEWIILDRLCSGACVIGTGLIGWWVLGVFRKVCWSSTRDQELGDRFCEYTVLGAAGVGCPGLSADLREIRFAELCYGVDGFDLRKRRFLQWFSRESELIQRELPRLGYFFIGLDLGGFVLGGLGFVLVPFLAWIETASGT